MSSASLITLIVLILAIILVDIFCADVSNSVPRSNRQQAERDLKNTTTPWPTLRQKSTPRRWIQQNNVWIRNEQAASAQRVSPIRDHSTSTSKPPLNRENTYTVLKPQIVDSNKQQGLVNGVNGATENLSYAGAVKPSVPSPSNSKLPVSHFDDKTTVFSAGPTEDLDKPTNNQDSTVSDDELREFSENLLKKDSNNAMKYVKLNVQGKTSSRSSQDEAPLPLMKIEEGAFRIPSIEKLILLYNNYFLDVMQNEVYTGQERIEENNFLDIIVTTPVMQFTRSFLVQKGKIGKDPREFKDLLRLIWFNMYSRGNGRIGSSGFEHVFIGEIKNNQVSGLHNWVYFNEEESQGRANYLGYMNKVDLGDVRIKFGTDNSIFKTFFFHF
ncbi:hypothetical protein ABEB36_002131 [Hypothenemus hampei]|uniref:EndoU domain-containing protein n=1 Tax=Hypothenemus hampei TaxID=57062 RepID=A0ABD1F5B2_HYPHA